MEYDQSLPDGLPVPGRYRHYKGAMYQVLGAARHSETEEWMVVYQALYGEKGFWVRPLSIWLQPVHDNKIRFELVNSSDRSLTQLTKQG